MPYLLLQSLRDFLVLVLCNVHISSHPLNKQANNTSWRRKTLILSFKRRGPGAHCVTMEMSQWKYHETLCWLQQLYKVSVLYRKSLRRYSIFCDVTLLCVHNVTSPVIQPAQTKIPNNPPTKSAITTKQTPFLIILKALSNKPTKSFLSYALQCHNNVQCLWH